MVEKRSEYDTDPLDPDFVRRTDEVMGGGATAATEDFKSAAVTEDFAAAQGERPTEHFQSAATAPTAPTFEEPTRRLEEPIPQSYPSVFVPPVYQPPANYTSFGSSAPPNSGADAPQHQSPQSFPRTPPTSRAVRGISIPENIAMVLPYAPFYIGLVASIIELLLVPRSEYRVRFYAAQGLALQLAIIAISFLFGALRLVTGTGFGGWLFSLAAFIFLIVSMVRVWKGEEHRLAPLDEVTRKINQQFEPKK